MNGFNDNEYAYYGDGAATPSASPVAENNMFGVARIKVFGVGGAGNNAVDRLIEAGTRGIECVVVNTDNQVLARSKANKQIQIGVQLTKGLGAGSDPNIGREAAEENKAEE